VSTSTPQPTSSLPPRLQLAGAVRERFVTELTDGLLELVGSVEEHLMALMSKNGTTRENQTNRDNWMAYKSSRSSWHAAVQQAWRKSLQPLPVKKPQANDFGGLELMAIDAMDTKILVSRLVQGMVDKITGELEDLRLRMRLLESTPDLLDTDILRPDVVVQLLLDEWTNSGMPAESWQPVSPIVQKILTQRLHTAYKNANALLIKQGVLPVIDLKDRVKAPSRAAPLTRNQSGLDTGSGPESTKKSTESSRGGDSTPFWKQSANAHAVQMQDSDDAQMASSPLARMRSRAQGVLGQIRQLFASQGAQVGAGMEGAPRVAPSAALVAALAPPPAGVPGTFAPGGTVYQDYSPAGVVRVAEGLREQTTELKKKAETKGEKATIEIVALMFQAILAEDRIPTGIRVWFARLQMPVLRVALEDPDFFGTTTHPARMLIDRMGSCVMGFDSAGVNGGAMEAEVKRIVQVIEQYPETGKKVYKIVYDEFQKFLAKFLIGKGVTEKVVSVAQQVEQKETLTIQYTIEMRDMLKDMPVRTEIRDFLFKVWAEVLAVAAVRKGPQHAETVALKKTATALVWAASAKPNRADRTKVIQDLPNLLTSLRTGMSMLAMGPSEQDGHIKVLSDIMADAFMAKTQAIPQEKIDVMAERLGNLEDFVNEDGVGDLPLDAESIEMMLGIDASAIEVVGNGGSKPTAAMLAWAQELQLGSWFTLDHNNHVSQVQFAWRSARKHLNLFASSSGHCFLIQGGRLAAYLQAGLIRPQEEEGLTVRATRDALAKLEANPERLLA
jgi:hypothetical protein